MQKTDTLQIALAGLVSRQETEIKRQFGDPPEPIREVIQLAAQLSAGMTVAMENTQPLESIFHSIKLDNDQPSTGEKQYFAPVALSLNKNAIFPKAEQAGKVNFDAEMEKISQAFPPVRVDDEGYLEEVLSALHRKAINLPSRVTADVSYFDQQRMTAALAVCLSEKSAEDIKGYLTSFKQHENEAAALLVGGDISGIQDFIYTITAKGAARSLRGRSFYLQLLTEAILRFVLRELKIPYTNVIYSGGGHFFLLAPPSAADQLAGIQQRITRTLLKHHRTSLYLALGHAEVSLGGFFGGQFPGYWGQMHGALANQKRHRYSELGNDFYEEVFAPPKLGGNPDNKCDVCGEDHRKTRPWGDTEPQDKACSLCYSFFDDIGRRLAENKFLALKFGSDQPAKEGTAMQVLAEFGMSFEFFESKPNSTASTQTVIWAFEDFEMHELPGLQGVPVWLRYTANRVTDLQFDELQKKVEGGFERLGVLRMDVDNLGEIFKRGLGDKATLTRLATLSYRVSLFFEGWLKKICDGEKYTGLIYTVYAGGDDVFLIGPWDVIPMLAQDIVHDFVEYTGKNPCVHVSAGMAFIDGKYPVYQAAEDAGDAIDAAKELDGKNAFAFLGKPWKWSTFDSIAERQERLSRLVKPQEQDKKSAPQALLQILQQLAIEEEEHKKEKGLHVWGRWIWMGMYQLTRMSEQNSDVAGEIQTIRNELQETNYQEINQWGVSARWAQLKERRKSKKEDAK